MVDRLQQMLNKKVDVMYEGLRYRGVLVWAGEDDLSLQTETDWVTLPMSGISDVQEVGVGPGHFR